MHRAGPRANASFVDLNCAAIPETLLEAELFGYEGDAFTDTRQSKPGLFQVAHGGTLLLAEIGLLPRGLQAKLLSVFDEAHSNASGRGFGQAGAFRGRRGARSRSRTAPRPLEPI